MVKPENSQAEKRALSGFSSALGWEKIPQL
jgi:hypothetical protein